jgi:hypothetical protein
MEPNLLELLTPYLIDPGAGVGKSTRSLDPHCHFTSVQASAIPALKRAASAMRVGPKQGMRILETLSAKASLVEFHEYNLAYVAEALEANLLQKQIEQEGETPAARAAFEKHCLQAEAFLGLAEEAATTVHHKMVVVENRASLDLLRGDVHKAVAGYVHALTVRHTETLWANLLIALDRIGAEDAVDAVLVTIGRIGTPRLLEMVSVDEDLTNVRSRAAYQQHVECRA